MFIVTIISTNEKAWLRNKKEANKYAKEVMRKQGKSVKIEEV